MKKKKLKVFALPIEEFEKKYYEKQKEKKLEEEKNGNN